MPNAQFFSYCKRAGLPALTGLALFMHSPLVGAQSLIQRRTTETVSFEQAQSQPTLIEQRAQVNYDAYILGAGDELQIELLDLPELSGRFSIGPDGTIYLPRLRAIYVEDLTVEELRLFLTQQFKTFVRNPEVYVRPVVYRPIRIYVSGEVKRPGYYTLTGVHENITSSVLPCLIKAPLGCREAKAKTGRPSQWELNRDTVPTVFDAIRTAQGITPYSDLAQVQVTRKRAQGLGGGRIATSTSFP